MAFPCPGCGSDIDADLEAWAPRCPACGARLRSRVVPSDSSALGYQVEVAGRSETGRRVEVPWDEAASRRLRFWLAVSVLLTVGSVLALYLLARYWR